MDPEDTLLTVEQVATMVHLRPTTIRAKINQGLLRAYKPPRGKNWLIRRSDAEGMLTGSQTPASRPSSPLIDRLGTSEGRARAIAFLRALREEDEDGEQGAAWEVLKHGVTPLSLRHWSPKDTASNEEAA